MHKIYAAIGGAPGGAPGEMPGGMPGGLAGVIIPAGGFPDGGASEAGTHRASNVEEVDLV